MSSKYLLSLKLPTIYVMAASKKINNIIGATGNQGSSVADEFLKASWNVRCLTRNPASSAPFALSALGVVAVQADLSDLSSLSKGFANINAIFLNINFRDTFRTILQAKPSVGEKSANEAAFNAEILNGKMQPL